VLKYVNSMTLKVLIHSAEEGGYWAEVPALPGCVSQGETVDDLRSNIREAIEGWLTAEDEAANAKTADQIIEVAV
jgi:predicted RNase H-like HicB family nuclease